jgi:hypothetical protein
MQGRTKCGAKALYPCISRSGRSGWNEDEDLTTALFGGTIDIINCERSEHGKALNSAKISKHHQTLCNPCHYSVCVKILVIWTAVILDGILTKKRTAGYGSFEFSNLLRLFIGENCFIYFKPQILPCQPFSLQYLPLFLLPIYLTQSN